MTSLWGQQTGLALTHFAIGAERMPIELIHAMVRIKAAAALVNARLGRLDCGLAQALECAAEQVLDGRHDAQFPLSPWQSGSGTQSHMNVNEVLAALAAQRLQRAVHANDEVNRGQSSNDTVPSALQIALCLAERDRLRPALERLVATLDAQAKQHAGVVKLGRTHLQDAVPLAAGQEFGAWASQVGIARAAIDAALPALHELPQGGTAVGTGLNTHPQFAAEVCRELAARTGIAFVAARDRFAGIAGADAVVAFHGALKTLATALVKLANDLRLLSSGPHGGLGEIRLPANEPGSSIMPGKVNPTQCEALAMVGWQVMANDLAVTLGAAGGQLQLNTARPLIALNALSSVRLLADAVDSFERHALQGLVLDAERIDAHLEASLMSATALAPHIGYDRAAAIVERARRQGSALGEAAAAEGVRAEDFARWTDPQRLLGPG